MNVDKRELVHMAKEYKFIGRNDETVNVPRLVIFLFCNNGSRMNYNEARASEKLHQKLMNVAANNEVTFDAVFYICSVLGINSYYSDKGTKFIYVLNAAYRTAIYERRRISSYMEFLMWPMIHIVFLALIF